MSGDSEELIRNQNQSEKRNSESNVVDTALEKRKYYCYACNVQCSSEKDFLGHQSGKRHLKNQSLEENKKVENVKKTIEYSTLVKPNEKKFDRPKAHDNPGFLDNSANEIMNNSNRYTPTNKRFQYDNPNYENKYSRYQNPKYSNNCGNVEFHYNSRLSRPYCDFTKRNTMHSANAPALSRYFSHEFNNEYYTGSEYSAPYRNDCSDNRYAFYNFRGNLERNNLLPNDPVNARQNYNRPYYNSFNFKASDKAESESNSVTSKSYKYSRVYSKKNSLNSIKSTEPNKTNICMNNLNVFSTSSSASDKDHQSQASASDKDNQSQASASDKDQSQASAADKDHQYQAFASNKQHQPQTSSQFSNSNTVKFRDNKRVRSRSLSSSESSGKRLNNKTVDHLLHSGSASEEQKIKEWTDSLLDTSQNNISRLIHPSNYKEKAAVNHLITKLSKTKRNENLTRLRSNSLGSTDVVDGANEDVNNTVKSIDIDSDEISIILDSNITSNTNSCILEPSKSSVAAVRKTKQISKKIKKMGNTNNKNSSNTFELEFPLPISMSESPKKLKKSLENRKVKRSNVCKRKSFDDNSSKEKKQKGNSSEGCENPSTSKTIVLESLNTDVLLVADTSNPSDSLKTTNPVCSSGTIPAIKEEIDDYSAANATVSSIDTHSQNMPNRGFEFEADISVETLIQLFASGSVKVKEEFNDPVMDALKGMSPDELINACSKQSFLNKDSETSNTPLDSDLLSSKDIDPLKTTVEENIDVNPLTLGSNADNVNSTPSSIPDIIPSFDKPENQNFPSTTNDENANLSNLSEVNNLNLLHKSNIELPAHVNKLINQLKEISSQEEIIKNNLTETKSKISELNFLLEEWKRKKKKLQEQEDDLRKQRNDIIQSLQSTVQTDDDSTDKPCMSSTEPLTSEQPKSSKIQNSNSNIEVESTSKTSYWSSTSVISAEKCQQQKKIKTVLPEPDEITILPPPMKPNPPEIIIFDEADESASAATIKCPNFGNQSVTHVIESNEPTIFEVKNIAAHGTIVNCLVVFENFLYTCSNDNTGKRFSLQDASLTVTYHHTSKNVTEIVVEKVQNEALVFTSCFSAKVISLFIASSGTKIKTFFPSYPVMSICKGWGRFYSGLANGSINVYNWKYEEREIVKTESSASRINTAHQGRLHVLIILSSDGNIAIRDAETGLLIRCIKTCARHPSWMTVYNDLTYLSSSDRSLIILDIMSGRVEKRLYLNSSTTGLAAYDDYIFTISYNGLINCFNKDSSHHGNKLYYGAGKNGLTCVHVYQDWVFTGNRKGNISLFQFDPCSSAACEFGKCDVIYGFKEDLEYHVEKDHLSKKGSAKCSWRGCAFYFPKDWKIKEKMNHFKEHVY